MSKSRISRSIQPARLVHLSDECVDMLFPITQITTFDKVLKLSGVEAARGVA